ncbi:MAG TPA: peptide MFS transporter [Candidatus Saccharimonadales bacterium]|nr:peptide MFS transporter [Candidatus Saccharimonadales bacterium]
MSAADRGWFGQPRGLSTLFFTEMWERLSYYGMRALLVLYMVAPAEKGGLGMATVDAAAIYGWYTGLAYAVSLPGGLIADRWLGQFRAILLGGSIIAVGHFCLAFPSRTLFFAGLGLIICGTGLLKPNITSMVGSLYDEKDPRRDSGFSIFYMGVNIGATLAPFVCGTLGQKLGWHYGFAAAGVGMVLGLIQYWLGRKRLAAALDRLKQHRADALVASAKTNTTFTLEEWKRLGVIAILFVFAAIFWAAFEQAGSSLNLFADQLTRLSFFGYSFPSTWFQSLNPIYIIIFAPFFSWMWEALGRKQPSSPAKFTFGLILAGLGFLVLVPGADIAQGQKVQVSPLWLSGTYLLLTWGELCLSPVSLSLVSKLAPARLLGTLMGFWYLSNAAGNKLSGFIAGYFDRLPLPRLFGYTALMCLVAGGILLLLIRTLKKLMGGVR